jgi:hypothetical protein
MCCTDVTSTEKNRSAVVGKHGGKTAFGTSRHKQKYSITVYLQEVE